MIDNVTGINVDLNTALDFCSLPILFLDTEYRIQYINFAGLNFLYKNEVHIQRLDSSFATSNLMGNNSNYLDNILKEHISEIENLGLGNRLTIQVHHEYVLHMELRIVPIFNSKYDRTGISIEIHDLSELYTYLNFLDESIDSAKEGNFSNLIPIDKIPQKTYLNLICTKVNNLLEYFNLFFNDVLMFLENLVEGHFEEFAFEAPNDTHSSQASIAWTGRQDISYVFNHIQKKYKKQQLFFNQISNDLHNIVEHLQSVKESSNSSTPCEHLSEKLHEFYLSIFGVSMDVEQVTVIIDATRNKLDQAQDMQTIGINVLNHLKEIQSTIEFLTHNIHIGLKEILSGIKHIEQGDIGLGMRLLKADSQKIYKLLDESLARIYRSLNSIGVKSDNNSIDVILNNASQKMTETDSLLDLLTNVLTNVREILNSQNTRFEELESQIKQGFKSNSSLYLLSQSIEDIKLLNHEFKERLIG